MANTVTRSGERVHDTVTLSFTGRIAAWSARHRWWVVAASVLIVVSAMLVSSTVETKLLDGDEGGVGDSSRAAQLIDERFGPDRVSAEQGDSRGPTEILVFSDPSLSVEDPLFRSEVELVVLGLRALPEVKSVASYYDTASPDMVSGDGHAVLARVVIESGSKNRA